MNVKGIVTFVLLAFVLVAAIWTFTNKDPVVENETPSTPVTDSPDEVDDSSSDSVPDDSVDLISDGLVVFYMHGNARCTTCLKFEEYSNNTMAAHYSSEIEDGTVQWVILNTDEDDHEHYNDRYELYTRAVIVSERVDGEEVRWKDLKDIWTEVASEERFAEYLTSEINMWLEDDSA